MKTNHSNAKKDITSDDYSIKLKNQNTHEILKSIAEILEASQDKTDLFLSLTKPAKLNLLEALKLVALKPFIARYCIKTKYLSHKKNGYNTAGHPYEFNETEVRELKNAIHKLGEELQSV